MNRLRRTNRAAATVFFVTLPVTAPLWLLTVIGHALVWFGNAANDAFGDLVVCLFETDEQVRERRRADLRKRAGTWLRFGCWVCACPHTHGRGMDRCDRCGTSRPSLEMMPAQPARPTTAGRA